MVRLSLVLLAACGRIGFDATGGTPSIDAPAGDGIDSAFDAAIDAPPGSMTFTFGEAPGTMFNGVTRDTFISNEAGETGFNYGGDNEVRIERDAGERALIRFDVSAIPINATVLDAKLEVTITQIPPAPLPIKLHRLLELWDEGGQAGNAGVANFINRTAPLAWSTAGAGPTTSATAEVGGFTPTLGRETITIPAAVIDVWKTPSTNFGLVMISTSDDSTRFTTREGTPSADRPVLTVTFVP